MQLNILLVSFTLLASLAPAMAVKAGEQMAASEIFSKRDACTAAKCNNMADCAKRGWRRKVLVKDVAGS
ncbi:hypothetical protein ACLOAV_000547 [Pseudogymnoascus australis]